MAVGQSQHVSCIRPRGATSAWSASPATFTTRPHGRGPSRGQIIRHRPAQFKGNTKPKDRPWIRLLRTTVFSTCSPAPRPRSFSCCLCSRPCRLAVGPSFYQGRDPDQGQKACRRGRRAFEEAKTLPRPCRPSAVAALAGLHVGRRAFAELMRMEETALDTSDKGHIAMDNIRRTLRQAVTWNSVACRNRFRSWPLAPTPRPFIGLFGTVWGIMHTFTPSALSNPPPWPPWPRASRAPWWLGHRAGRGHTGSPGLQFFPGIHAVHRARTRQLRRGIFEPHPARGGLGTSPRGAGHDRDAATGPRGGITMSSRSVPGDLWPKSTSRPSWT